MMAIFKRKFNVYEQQRNKAVYFNRTYDRMPVDWSLWILQAICRVDRCRHRKNTGGAYCNAYSN